MTEPSPAVPGGNPAQRWLRDPRHYQIAVLSALLVYGVLALDFGVRPRFAAVVLGTALGVQYLLTRWVGLPAFDPRSPLISGLSLCLLLRTGSLALAAAAAAVTIAGKFLIRRRGKHVFNPTNFGLVVMLLATDAVWVSPGQWGSAAFFGFLLACLGGLVVHRAARADVTVAFLLSWAAVLFARAAWLGDPWTIPLHQLQSGALLIFAFFMISDPKTTPDRRAGRLLFAALVAVTGAWAQFGLYVPEGLLYALAAGALTVPAIDRLLPAPRYEWPGHLGAQNRNHAPRFLSPRGDPPRSPGNELPLPALVAQSSHAGLLADAPAAGLQPSSGLWISQVRGPGAGRGGARQGPRRKRLRQASKSTGRPARSGEERPASPLKSVRPAASPGAPRPGRLSPRTAQTDSQPASTGPQPGNFPYPPTAQTDPQTFGSRRTP